MEKKEMNYFGSLVLIVLGIVGFLYSLITILKDDGYTFKPPLTAYEVVIYSMTI